MHGPLIINPPGSFIPAQGLAFGAPGSQAVYVDGENPLPVVAARPVTGSTPVSGTLSVSDSSSAFLPDLDRPIWLTLSGSWAGTVALERSVDAGDTWQPATLGGVALSWTARVNEPVAVESVPGARWRIAFARTSGALTYEVRQ